MKNKKTGQLDPLYKRELEIVPQTPINEYYIDVANKFKTAKFIGIIILVAFVLVMISVFRSDVTLENCKYLVRFFSSANTTYSGDFENIYYDTSGVVSVDVFNEDLVTIKSDSVEFYDMRGNNIASYEINQISPTAVSCGKYMLVYDLGGTTYKLFNNFSSLTEGSFEQPIYSAAVSSEGMYAIATKGLDYQSVIYLYDHHFNLISKIYKDRFITDLEIDSSGEKLLCTSFVAEQGRYMSEVMTYAPYTDKEESNHKLNDSFAACCGFFEKGGYSVLTEKALLFYDEANNPVSEYPLGNNVPTGCIMLDNYCVLTFNESIVGSDTRILAFSYEGSLKLDSNVSSKLLSTDSCLEMLYLLCEGELLRIDLNTGERAAAPVDPDVSSVCVSDNDTVVLGYSNMAKAFKAKELFVIESEETK